MDLTLTFWVQGNPSELQIRCINSSFPAMESYVVRLSYIYIYSLKALRTYFDLNYG